MNRNILKYSIHFFCLYFFSLYVSVLFSSCAVSPVSLYLVSDTRVSCIPRPGCHAIPFRISVFSFSLPLFLSARMRIYYNVSLLPDFPSSLKKHVLQHICQSAFYKNVQEKLEKIPLYIWRVYYKVLLLHPLSRTGAAMFWHSDRNGVGTLTYFFCLGLVSFWIFPFEKAEWKKLPKTFGRYEIKFLPLHPLSKSKQRWLTLFLESGSVKQSFFCSPFRKRDDGKKGRWKKTSENIWKIYLKVFTFASAFLKRKPT